MIPVLSVRNSTLPALISLIALATSNVTVPVLGLGMRPRGPSTFPRRPADFIMSGVAITASKSGQPSTWARALLWFFPSLWAITFLLRRYHVETHAARRAPDRLHRRFQ